jgi:hypothetical protein
MDMPAQRHVAADALNELRGIRGTAIEGLSESLEELTARIRRDPSQYPQRVDLWLAICRIRVELAAPSAPSSFGALVTAATQCAEEWLKADQHVAAQRARIHPGDADHHSARSDLLQERPSEEHRSSP